MDQPDNVPDRETAAATSSDPSDLLSTENQPLRDRMAERVARYGFSSEDEGSLRREEPLIGDDEEIVVPVVEETIDVQTRKVATGKVRITKVVHEREEAIDEPLLYETVDVERVKIDRVVDGPVAMRQEGDTLIIPILEEVLVVEKRLILKEEVRITRRRTTKHHSEQITLRSEEPAVERIPPDAAT